jgi:hypothetical protein
MATSTVTSVKTVGSNGQVSLGKQFAGRQVLIEEREPGVWLIRTAQVIPDNERWLQQPKALDDLKRGLDWAMSNPVDGSNADALLESWHDEA